MKARGIDTAKSSDLLKKERFDELYAKLHHALYANIFKIVRNDTTTEDLLQDVFTALWERIDEMEYDHAVNWLFVVSFNKSVSFLKKANRISTEPYSGHLNTGEAPNDWDEDDFATKLSLLYEAIDELPERKKFIFREHRIKGRTLEHIAAELELSVHTVKDHLKLANKLIRSHVSKNSTSLKTIAEMAICLLLLTF